MLEILAPVTFIYINRRDKVAQAISMAKAMQTNAWISFDQVTGKNTRYDADFIEQCKNESSSKDSIGGVGSNQRRYAFRRHL